MAWGPARMSEPQFSAAQVSRLIDLVSKFSKHSQRSPSEAIDWLARARLDRPKTRPSGKRLVRMVDAIRRVRTRRNRQVGAALFRDPGWDMMLELYSAHQRGIPISVSSVCYAAEVPATTGLRHLRQLEAHGLVERSGDPRDNRRLFVKPTPQGLEFVEAAAEALVEPALEVVVDAEGRGGA